MTDSHVRVPDQALESLRPPSIPEGGRAGIGFDAHRLVPGRPLRLGGVEFPEEHQRLAGHSDGDVVLHALTDALLGAAHLGDIGTLFPSTDQRWRGANSGELLRIALDRAKAAGWRPTSADVVVVAPRPHIGEARPRMEERMASLLGIDREMVSVKGTTSDGLGITADEAIAAYAIIVVEWRS